MPSSTSSRFPSTTTTTADAPIARRATTADSGADRGAAATVPAMTTDPNLVYEAILGLRRGGKAIVLLTYRGDW